MNVFDPFWWNIFLDSIFQQELFDALWVFVITFLTQYDNFCHQSIFNSLFLLSFLEGIFDRHFCLFMSKNFSENVFIMFL